MRRKISNYKQINTINRGFTLIEILVVITIIAVMIGLAFPNFFAARQRARDVQRKSDLKQLQKGLELYKQDQNPIAFPSNYPTSCTTNCQLNISCGSQWNNGGSSIYMSKMPCDPLAPTPYFYQQNASDSLNYTLVTCLENKSDPDADSSCNSLCNCSNQSSYTLNAP